MWMIHVFVATIRRLGMSTRVKAAMSLFILCIACMASAACGSSAPASGGASNALRLHVTLTKSGVAGSTLDADVRDSAAAERLYNAALALPAVPPNRLMSCPADDGARYHLTFSGGSATVHEMVVNASGCRFIALGVPMSETHLMNDAFVSLFTQTLGVSSLDPLFP
jgi:hypothetical protein